MTAKLTSHWMFQYPQTLRRIQMCDTCRVKGLFSRNLTSNVYAKLRRSSVPARSARRGCDDYSIRMTTRTDASTSEAGTYPIAFGSEATYSRTASVEASVAGGRIPRKYCRFQ